MKTIIIDKDAAGIALQVRNVFPECLILGAFTDWTSGWEAIQLYKPEIVLVSLEPDDFSGLEMIEQLERDQIEVAILSEWATFAYEAQTYGAAFLIKPLKDDALAKTLTRMARRTRDRAMLRQLVSAGEGLGLHEGAKPANRIALVGRNTIDYIRLQQIVRYEMNKPFRRIILQNGQTIPLTLPLGDLEQRLHQYPFAKANRSCVINLHQVERYYCTEKTLVLSDGAHVQLSQDCKLNVLKKLTDC